MSSRAVIVALVVVLMLACFSAEVSDSDTFWHLATGRYILQNHHLPVPDPFAWATYLGKLAYAGEGHTRYFNLTHEWLAQIYLYGVYSVGGYPGMVIIRALLMTLVCAGVGLIAWRRTQHFYLSVGAALLLLGVQYRKHSLFRLGERVLDLCESAGSPGGEADRMAAAVLWRAPALDQICGF